MSSPKPSSKPSPKPSSKPIEYIKVELKNFMLDRQYRGPDDSYTIILARALLLFLLTFDLFLNAYVMLSVDRYNLLIGALTIGTCAIGQGAAITGQFGFPLGNILLKLFVLSAFLLLTTSLLVDQFEQNFMTELSFTFTLSGLITGCFIWLKS